VIGHDWDFFGVLAPGSFVLVCTRCGMECDPLDVASADSCTDRSVEVPASTEKPLRFRPVGLSEFSDALVHAGAAGRARLEALRKRAP
jgi:hypothetical protein